MSASPSVFPLVHIALTAAITAGVSLLVLVVLLTRFKVLALADCLLVPLVAGISVLVWRSAGNTGALNNDPIPAVSPNDVLCPLVTYLCVGFYAAFRLPLDARRFEQARVLLTLIFFVGSTRDDLTRKRKGMASKLILRQYIPLPPHPAGDFDHGDVYLPTGRVFIANTAAGTVEVVDGERLRHLGTIPGCPEASGVLCAQDDALIFAAARGASKLLVIDPFALGVLRAVAVGARPNGLAWDSFRRHLLVADVQDNTARLVDPQTGEVMASVELPGRPRWAVYHQAKECFLVNIREPACVVVLSADPFALVERFPISSPGPHGLDLDQDGRRAFVACDGSTVVTLDLASGREQAQVSIAGSPDAIWHNHRLGRLHVAIAHLGILDKATGVINVVNTQSMTVEEQIITEAGAHTTTYDARRQRLYVFLPSCRVAVYEESEVP